jgi:hypothetical protein
MVSSLALTWSTLTTQYAAAIWPPLVPLARTYYAQQGQLVTAASYLALPPATAAQPFIGNVDASQLVIAVLPSAGPADETYPQYVMRGADYAQPLLNQLIIGLQERAITLADFTQALATQETTYLAKLLGPEFWTPAIAAWQQQVQRQLDVEGRWQRLVDAQVDPGLQAVLVALSVRLSPVYPTLSLNEVGELPLNELARALWTPLPAPDDQAITRLLNMLQTAAQSVVAQNYPDVELPARLFATVPAALGQLAQALLTASESNPAVTTVAELATAEVTTLANRLVLLPANHPWVYALAAWMQDVIRQFLRADNPATLLIPSSLLPVRGQLLGVEDKPLANFALQLSQVFSSRQGMVRALGELRTSSDGHFELNVDRDLYLDDNDAVAEAPATVQAAVYYPGQDPNGEPALTLVLVTGETEVSYPTDLPPTVPALASRAVSILSLPASIDQLLAEQGIASLADVRAVGGVQQFVADLDDPDAVAATRRLDGLAQFEVVSNDSAFHEQVVDQGFYSPAQLLDSTSQAEFVARLAADSTDEAQRTQAITFYQQAATAQALSQTLGLLTASAPVSTIGTAGRPSVVARFANLGQLASQGVIDGDSTTSAFGPTTVDATNAPTLPGYHILDGFNAATVGPEIGYQADGQCDCLACRSAVSPTAYLASLLKYASQNLRYPDSGTGTPTTPTANYLQSSLLQPYCDLAVNCQSADEQVCQYRLAIEVLQADWRQDATRAATPLTLASARPYVEGVLEALLQALGTSLAEVRAITNLTLSDLASRLRLPTGLVSQLQTRFSISQLNDTRSLDAVESDLAELFGLASTAVDPLRTGLLLTSTASTDTIKLVRWNLQGIEYGINTDANGQLSVTVVPMGTKPHLIVYAGQPTEDNVVARGTLLESDSVSHTFTGLLYPQHGSGLSGSVMATLTGSASATFTIAVVPTVTAGRQQVLAAEWLSEDAAAVALLQAHSVPSWNGFTFLVDPDLLGPDDFRSVQPAQAGLGNRAYQLWRRRYDFLQDQLAPALLTTAATTSVGTLGTLLDALTSRSLTYNSDGKLYAHVPWNTVALTAYTTYYQSTVLGTTTLARLHADCAGNTAGAPLAAALLGSIGLSTEAMQRLYDLWQLNLTQVLSNEDLQEALDIVRQSVKKCFEANWTAEEQGSNPVDLSSTLFQSALHEPQAGIWQQIRSLEFGFTKTAQLPRIDPDEVTPLDLPDAGLSDQASKFWSDRQAELLQKRQTILASGISAPTAQLRADAMLTYAYRVNRFDVAPIAVLPGIPPSSLTTFEAVVAASQNSADPQNNTAQAYLAAILNLRVAEAARLVELRAQVLTQPADTLWQEMAVLLTSAWKRAVAYRLSYVPESTPAPAAGTSPTSPSLYVTSWLAQETSVSAYQTTPLDYFIGTRKHRLVKWRANAATRTQWVQALTLAGQRPLIDPDQLVPGDFRQAGERSRSSYSPAVTDLPYLNPAFDLYQRRRQVVTAWFSDQQTAWQATQAIADTTARQTAAWLVITDLLRSSRLELETLYTQQHAGVDVSSMLRRLQLTPDGLDLLVTQANGIETDRATEVPHLLTQVLRQRQYAAWAREEIALRIVPTPYYFRQPQAEAESLATQPWRSSAVERRQWQRSLTARFGQAAALTAAQEQAVKATEEQYLNLLRDAVLMAKVGTGSDTLATRAMAMEDKYLLDFQTVCCQHTTRVAQASTVLQKLFTNVRGGLSSNDFTLAQDDATFESDWQWLSSYERWRSLMFLYLYPQNVLLPALKPGQTSQFRQTVSAIRAAASTSASDARGYMDEYQAYLEDMGTLVIATATETSCDGISTDGFTAAGERQPVSIQVALAASHIAYANIFNLTNGPTESSFTWVRLPGEVLVERIVGSAAYQPQSGQRYVYVFVLLREEQKNALTAAPLYLAFQRLNLTSLTWEAEYTSLNISDLTTLDASSVQIVSGGDETWAPVILGLRNRRVLLYTDYPFSQSTVVGSSDQELYHVLNEYDHYNIDLFFALLDPAGTGVGLEQARTIFLCVSAQLLTGVRLQRDRIMLCTALGVGTYKQIKLSIFQVKLADCGNQIRYLIPHEFSTPGALTVTGTANGGTLQTSLFSSGSLTDYFLPIINKISMLVQAGEASMDPKFLIESMGGSVALAGQANIVNSSILAERNTALVSAGARVTVTQASSTPGVLDDFTLIAYYNTYTQVPATPTGIATHAITFAYTNFRYYQNGTASVVIDLGLPYSYQGPATRSGYLDAGTATPTVRVSETNNSRYPLQRGTLDISYPNTSGTYPLHEILDDLPPLFSSLEISALNERRTKIGVNINTDQSAKGVLISEAYYALPMLLAQELTRSRNYELALHYYRLVYDYTRLPSTALNTDPRLVYPGLYNANTTPTYDTVLGWLQNPNNPYTLAALRPNAHLDYVVMSVVRCLLAYADTEFTADTTESVDRARTLYEVAARLLKQDITQYAVMGTSDLLDPLDVLFPATWLAEWQSLKGVLARVNQRAVLEQLLNRAAVSGGNGLKWLFGEAQAGRLTWLVAFDQAWKLVNGQFDALTGGYMSLCATTGSALAFTPATPLPFTLPAMSIRPYVPFLTNTAFCVPTNPVPFALALQAELNLFKIRSCRNIAGVQRELDPYAAATDTTTGLPTLSSTGQLSRSARLVVPATPFRYAYIMERARNLVALAQQTESSLLSALEKRDAEAYNQLKARQDIAVSQATVQLQSLRVTEAEDGVDLSSLQLEKSEIMEDQYTDWLNDGLNGWEIAEIAAISVAGAAKALAALADGVSLFSLLGSGGASAVGAGYAAVAALADATAQIAGLNAGFDRREQEWNFQKNLAAQDIIINQQQIKISNDQLKVVGQEKRISQLQLDHATAVLTFLTTKFTNAELYDWMSGILQSAYSYFLQQATATARLAEQQLAFERQQVPGGIVQADYYSDPVQDATYDYSTTSSSSTTDRRGLTGSVRLLQDLTRLDEYAFETTKRKLQLSKTISLAQSFPTEFVRFRDTGVVSFACQPEWFDQDFPGQYLRVLRRVRTSVIALVPTVDGIKARLSTAGTSHVTVDGAPFQTLTLPRAQEVVALTSPSNATGLFELDQQSSELLLPFEGLGVDVPWQFSMQPASNPNLDYSAVADVLITLDYSALESADYARQVVKQLGTERQQQVVLSMRDRFADQWYDLHHADEVAPAQQYVSTLTLTADDLPRNLRGASVSQVSIYVDAPLDDDDSPSTTPFKDRSHLELRLTRGTMGGAAFTNQYGLISTRTGTGSGPLYTGNAGALVPLIGSTPAGDWTLTIGPGRLRDRLAAGLVNDIYLIVEVEGNAPAYVF